VESQTTLKKRLQNRNLQDTKSVMEEKIKPEAGDTGEEAKVPGESGTPKEGPAEEPAEEPVVRKSARARIQELVKQREEAIRLAQKPTKPRPSEEEGLEEGEGGEEEFVDRKTVRKIIASEIGKAIKEAIAPLSQPILDVFDQQELTEALQEFPDQAKNKAFIQKVVKYGETHKTVPFRDIIQLKLAEIGKSGVKSPEEEEAEKTRIGGKPSPTGRREPSAVKKETKELEKEAKEASPEEMEEALERGF